MKRITAVLISTLLIGAIVSPITIPTQAGGFFTAIHPTISGDLVISAVGVNKLAAFKVGGPNTPVWSIEYKDKNNKIIDRIYASPTAFGDKVFIVVPKDLPPYRFLTCYEASTGKMIWETPINKGVFGRPMIIDNKVIIGTTGIGVSTGTVEVYNANDGKFLWQWDWKATPTGWQCDGWVIGNPAYNNGTLFVGSMGAKVVPIDFKSGKPGKSVWRNVFMCETLGPSPNPEKLLFDYGPIEGDIVLDVDNLYFGCMGGVVYCVSAKEGTLVWKSYNKSVHYARSSPLITNGKVFIGAQKVFDKGSGLYVLDVKTGSVIGSYKTDDYVNSTPVLYGSNIIFGCDNGIVYCLNQDLTEVWKSSIGGFISCKPVISGENVIITSRDSNYGNRIVVLKASSGTKVWSADK